MGGTVRPLGEEIRSGAAAPIRVVVAGASGRMGREVLLAVESAPDLILVGAVSRGFAGAGRPEATPLEADLASRGVATFSEIGPCLEKARPHVLVEFTSAAVGPGLIRAALEAGVRPVSGTTGIPPGELDELRALTQSLGLGAVVVPNFSLGATILSILARTAAPYFRGAEIIELHHDQKRDAPSGTALALARVVGSNLARSGAGLVAAGLEPRPARVQPREAGIRTGPPEVQPPAAPEAAIPGAGTVTPPGPVPAQPSRGLVVDGVPVHSVRLSGLVAHHELVFASTGETLTLRHDSISRASFMPGVLLAVRAVGHLKGLVTSLEELLKLGPPDTA